MLTYESATTRITYRHGWTPERVNEWLAGEPDEPGAKRSVGFKVPSDYVDESLLKGPRMRAIKRRRIGRWRWRNFDEGTKQVFVHGVWECTGTAVHMTASPTAWKLHASHVYICIMETHGWYGFKWTGKKYRVVAEAKARHSAYCARLANRHVLLTVARITYEKAPPDYGYTNYTKQASP